MMIDLGQDCGEAGIGLENGCADMHFQCGKDGTGGYSDSVFFCDGDTFPQNGFWTVLQLGQGLTVSNDNEFPFGPGDRDIDQ